MIIAAGVGVILTPLYGALTDRVGRKAVYNTGVITVVMLTFPSLRAIQTGVRAWIWLGIIIPFGVCYFAIYAPLSTFWSELFDTRYRYTGVGAVYQFSGIYASGLTLLIGSVLITADHGHPWFFAAYMVLVGAVSFTCTAFLPETYRRPIMPAASSAGIARTDPVTGRINAADT